MVHSNPSSPVIKAEFLSRRRGPRRLMGNVVQKGTDRPLGNPGKGGPEAASAHVLRSTWAHFLVLQVLPGALLAVASCSSSVLVCTWCKVGAQRVQPRVRGRSGSGSGPSGGRKEGRGGAGPGQRRVHARSLRIPPAGVSEAGLLWSRRRTARARLASRPASLRAGALCSLSLPEEGALGG